MEALPLRRRYLRPETLEAAQEALRAPGSRPIANGTHLLGHLDPQTTLLVDLQALGLETITSHDDGRLSLGATATLQAVEDALRAETTASARLLAESAHREAPRQVRQAATVGGTVALGDPASELLTALLALDAQIHLADGSRIALGDYQEGLIVAVEVPATTEATGVARIVRTPRDRPIVLVIAARDMSGGLRLAVAADAQARPVRLPTVEAALAGRSPEEALAQVGERAATALAPTGDFRGSAAYRREMIGVLARRALHAALQP